ncbi:MAG: hypothetical protein AB1758_00870 [Candidatus Eremiobacterota bacterium]
MDTRLDDRTRKQIMELASPPGARRRRNDERERGREDLYLPEEETEEFSLKRELARAAVKGVGKAGKGAVRAVVRRPKVALTVVAIGGAAVAAGSLIGALGNGQPAAAVPEAAPPLSQVYEPYSAPPQNPTTSEEFSSYMAYEGTNEEFLVDAYGHYGAWLSTGLPPAQTPVMLYHLRYPPYAMATLAYWNTQTPGQPFAAVEGNNYFRMPVQAPWSNWTWDGPSSNGMRVYSSAAESYMDFAMSFSYTSNFQQVQLLQNAQTDQEFFQALHTIGYLSDSDYREVMQLYTNHWGQAGSGWVKPAAQTPGPLNGAG